MQNNLTNKYIELKIDRDFGDIITIYFDFLKQNLKKFTSVFLSYNGIFIAGLLIVSYLLVSGFIGMITYENNRGLVGEVAGTSDSYLIYLGVGGILFAVIFILVGILNFSLAGSYMIKYEDTKGSSFDRREVWDLFKQRLGSIFVFILLLIFLYLAFFVISLVLAFIPILGMIVQYVVQFFITAWVGVSFFSLLQENKGITDAFGEGWNLVTNNFWKSVGVNFILGLLNGILLLVVLVIPGILIGFYTFHVVESDVDVGASIVPTIVFTLGTSIFLIIMVYAQCLSQFVNGILYYALHEKTYNTNTRTKIEQIGNQRQ
ncbi:hypothetical protein WIW50_18105 [Flavobacteriaceae bacterium 3-367]|uniref:hypothetical protein n=1 Tax=Eudoraea algarum TaxID=3417568 RepID=UPI00326944E6